MINIESYILTFRSAATGSIITTSRRTEAAARKALAEMIADPAIEWAKGARRKDGKAL